VAGGSRALLADLQHILAPAELLTDTAARAVYARDASHLTSGRPLAVALPADAEQAAAVVAACNRAGISLTCRGGGTGLSGGAVPVEGAVVLSLARLTDLDPPDNVCSIRCGAGVLNERVSRSTRAAGLHFAPDPSSQSASTIGGNIAENAGGPHCLRHGVTLQHVLGLEWIDAAGRRWHTGYDLRVERGLDLRTLLCGSEGTLGVVTRAALRLTPNAESAATLLAFFPELAAASRAVVGLLGSGLLPVALEMVDRGLLEAIEAAFGFGFPTDVQGALIVEFAGAEPAVTEDADRAVAVLRDHGARALRTARDAEERDELWRSRKQAFGAFGRLAPGYISMDVVVPLRELPALVAEIQDLKERHGVEIATAFHAGDGNCHPGIHYDENDPQLCARAEAAADAILQAALRRGGSITGEHGIGLEKLHALPWQVDAEAGRLMRGVRAAFDPAGTFNPGKLVTEDSTGWAELPSRPEEVVIDAASLTVTAPAEVAIATLQEVALEHGLWLPVGIWTEPGTGAPGLGSGGTVRELVDHLVAGPALLGARPTRDILLEVWARTGDDRPFHAGAPVVKNVAGYDLARFLCGTGGALAVLEAATFQLRPAPECAAAWRFRGETPVATVCDELRAALDLLAGWDADLAGTTLVLEVAGATGDVLDDDLDDDLDVATSLTVLTAGRDRRWDLTRRGEELARTLAHLGAPVDHRRVPFAAASRLLDAELVPSWALASPDWTLMQRVPGVGDGWNPTIPEFLPRMIWQAAPRGCWSPSVKTSTGRGWHSDVVWRAGDVTTLPEPTQQVPRALLRELKRLFDPGARLPTPAWLDADPRRRSAGTGPEGHSGGIGAGGEP